jgi:hypothetical protein
MFHKSFTDGQLRSKCTINVIALLIRKDMDVMNIRDYPTLQLNTD